MENRNFFRLVHVLHHGFNLPCTSFRTILSSHNCIFQPIIDHRIAPSPARPWSSIPFKNIFYEYMGIKLLEKGLEDKQTYSIISKIAIDMISKF